MIGLIDVKRVSRTSARQNFYSLCEEVRRGEIVIIEAQQVREPLQPREDLMVCISMEMAKKLGINTEGDRHE